MSEAGATQLVLVGAGHAHLIALEGLARRPLPNVQVHWVSRGAHQLYSGMVPGLLAGQYPASALTVALAPLARAAGATLHTEPATSVDAERRRITLAGGASLSYDVASLDVGSLPFADDTPGVAEHAITLKPLERALSLADRARGDLAVVGGGAAGVELSLCLRARTGRRVSLVSAGPNVPRGASSRLERAVLRVLDEKAIARVHGEVVAVQADAVVLASGERIRCDAVVWATGPRAAPWLAKTGAAVSARGFLRVAKTLQSSSHPSLFGAGDCVDVQGDEDLPKAGVYAVRQGPVLLANLRAHLRGARLVPYVPQRGSLSLLNVGDGTAIASWKGRVARGRWAWHLKDRIDKKFMARFQRFADPR